MVNEHKPAAHTDSPDGGIGKTCLGGDMSVPVYLVPYKLRHQNGINTDII